MHICTHTHEASTGCFFTIASLVSLVISIRVPPFIVPYGPKNGDNIIKFGGDGGIRIIEKSSHSVDNTKNRHFQACISCKISSVSPLFLLLTTSIVVKTVVNFRNDNVLYHEIARMMLCRLYCEIKGYAFIPTNCDLSLPTC